MVALGRLLGCGGAELAEAFNPFIVSSRGAGAAFGARLADEA